MNNKHLSWNKEINNNFIIASRAYFLQYLDKVFKKFKMDQSKKGFLPVLQGVKLSQIQLAVWPAHLRG